jgi:hypothetical protein
MSQLTLEEHADSQTVLEVPWGGSWSMHDTKLTNADNFNTKLVRNYLRGACRGQGKDAKTLTSETF